MTAYKILDSNEHAHLRIRSAWQNAPHFVQIVVSEFAAAAACCPVLFTKDSATGAFFPGAVFGFKPGESMAESVAERTGFVPLNLQRDGFFISDGRLVIDRDNPRFSETEGERLFDEAAQPAPVLNQIQRALGLLQAGNEETKTFIDALLEAKLLEPIDISLSFDDGERLDLQGLYTVSLDALHDADDGVITRLFRAGHLQLAYAMIGSLKQVAVFAHERNRRLAAGK